MEQVFLFRWGRALAYQPDKEGEELNFLPYPRTRALSVQMGPNMAKPQGLARFARLDCLVIDSPLVRL